MFLNYKMLDMQHNENLYIMYIYKENLNIKLFLSMIY